MSTPNLKLPEIAASQSQKHITNNEALAILDAVVNLSVLSQSVTSDPVSPADGVRYLVPAGASGAFAGHDGKIASYRGGVWTFYDAATGWRAFVADEGGFAVHDGTNWSGPDPSLISVTPNGAESRIVTVEEELNASPAMTATANGGGAGDGRSHNLGTVAGASLYRRGAWRGVVVPVCRDPRRPAGPE